MTTAQPVRIIRERHYFVSPVPGENLPRVAITYQLPPMPPRVAILEDKERTPQDLRNELLAHAARRGATQPRDI